MPNFTALRATVFLLSTKNLPGGADIRPPSVRGLNLSPRPSVLILYQFGDTAVFLAADCRRQINAQTNAVRFGPCKQRPNALCLLHLTREVRAN